MNMIFHSSINGNEVYSLNGHNWYYSNNDERVREDNVRLCPKCGYYPTKKGHDHCIANLPGVEFACCGHGKLNGGGYIKFILDENGLNIFNETRETIYDLEEPLLFRTLIERLKSMRRKPSKIIGG